MCLQSAMAGIETVNFQSKEDLLRVLKGVIVEAPDGEIEAKVPVVRVVQNDLDGGDGKSDGGVQINSLSLGGKYGAQMFLGKAAAADSKLTVSTNVFNVNASYVSYEVQLFNKTDKKVLATSGMKRLQKKQDSIEETVKFSYKLTKDDLGDEIYVRWVQISTDSISRDLYVDNVSVVSEGVTPK